MDFYAPTATVESIMEHLSRDIDVIRPNVVKHPLTQEVKECEEDPSRCHLKKSCIPPREEVRGTPHFSLLFNSLTFDATDR